MTDATVPALLPAGLMDVLPPFAAFEAETVERLIRCFAGYGYERVKPPLIEFEDTALAGSAAALAPRTFRLMDPMAQRMLALRPDMTMQVARIAGSRLAHWPRPLRLSYAGQVLRVRGTQLRPARQFGQVGAEIVGAGAPAADVEVITMAAAALAAAGVAEFTVDLALPTLVPAILATSGSDASAHAEVLDALDRKDIAGVEALADRVGAGTARLLAALIALTGPAGAALDGLAELALPPAADAERRALVGVHDGLMRAAPGLCLSVDPVEQRGFEYHTGVTFSLFSRAVSGELGRGGRYRTGSGEAATGVTLFLDTLLRALPPPRRPARVFLPAGTALAEAERLRAAGWVTVAALDAALDAAGPPLAEARRLGCSHIVIDGSLQGTGAPAAVTGSEDRE
jgi:ATP phosphoribosyltransferase regulatory subunit